MNAAPARSGVAALLRKSTRAEITLWTVVEGLGRRFEHGGGGAGVRLRRHRDRGIGSRWFMPQRRVAVAEGGDD